MKKYKLIKEYPNSPKIGIFAKIEGFANSFYPYKTSCGHFCYTENQIENYPEFWELVVEKDYEILSMKCKKSKLLHFNNSKSSLNFMLKNDYSIHSIRRLSDGEIFTIGDKIFPNNKIYKFELKNNILKIWHCDISFSTPIIERPSGQPGNCSWVEGINNLKKIKQPLFTTEDGVDIFEGNKVYYVENYNLNWCIIPNYYKFVQSKTYFSTKEKAEEYVIMNKPCLSLNDYYSLFEEVLLDPKYNKTGRDLEKIVKNKLKIK